MVSARSIRAGAAYVELVLKDGKFASGLKKASRKLKAFGAGVTAIGAGITAVGIALAAPFIKAANIFASMGDSVEKMATRTGLSAEALSELGFAAEQSGADIGILEVGIRTMQRSVNDLGRGLTTAKDAFSDLGLTMQDLEGLSPEEQFKLIGDQISKIEDPTKRAAVAMQLMGRGGQKLLALFKDGLPGVEALQQQARDLGLTISSKDAKLAAEYTDQMNILSRVMRRGLFSVGSAVAPLLVKIADRITTVTKKGNDWIQNNKRLIATIFKVIVGVAAGGIVISALGVGIVGLGVVLGSLATILGVIGTAIGLMGAVLAGLLSPIGLVGIGIVGLGAYIVTSTDIGAKALQFLKDKFSTLKDSALSSFQGIRDALTAGNFKLAAKILWLTLKAEWQRGVNFLNGIWIGIKESMLSVASTTFFGVALLLNDAGAAIKNSWADTVAFLGKVWDIFSFGVKTAWNSAQAFLQKGYLKLRKLFDKSFDIELATELVDQEKAKKDKNALNDLTASSAEREEERKSKKTKIEKNREQSENELLGDFKKNETARKEKNKTDLDQTKEDLDKAKEELRTALNQAKKEKDEAVAARSHKGKSEDPLSDIKNKLAGIGKSLGNTLKLSTTGTFSAAALSGLGTGSVNERTAKASEQTAKNTKKLVDRSNTTGKAFT